MNNILFIRSDRFGEFVLSLPAIKLVKANFPESKIYLLAQKNNLELVKNIDFVDYFLEYNSECFSGYKGAFRLAKLFKTENIDTVVILNPKKEFHLASILAKIKVRIGYQRKWGFCLNRKIKDEKFSESKHEVEYNIDLVNLICENTYIPDVDLKVDECFNLDCLSGKLIIGKDEKLFVIHPFTSDRVKKIDILFWQKLITEIRKNFQEKIVIIGSQDEKQQAEVLAMQLSVDNITGSLSLYNLALFLKKYCRTFIGLDSGPLHLASLLKLPVVGLFKTTNPVRWGPFNTQCLVVGERKLDEFLGKIPGIVSFIKTSDK